jgi:hypothetical protein
VAYGIPVLTGCIGKADDETIQGLFFMIRFFKMTCLSLNGLSLAAYNPVTNALQLYNVCTIYDPTPVMKIKLTTLTIYQVIETYVSSDNGSYTTHIQRVPIGRVIITL